jgi:methyltransferase
MHAQGRSMSSTLQVWILITLGFLLTRIGELRMHRLNYDFLKAMGAEELIPSTMRHYYHLIFYMIPVGMLEYALSDRAALAPTMTLLLVVLIASSTLFRVYTIRSLGRIWSMRCMGFKGIYKVQQGPFKLFQNPEYVTRLIEGTCLLLLGNLPNTALCYAVLSLYFVRKITRIESRQLNDFCNLVESTPPYR